MNKVILMGRLTKDNFNGKINKRTRGEIYTK